MNMKLIFINTSSSMSCLLVLQSISSGKNVDPSCW